MGKTTKQNIQFRRRKSRRASSVVESIGRKSPPFSASELQNFKAILMKKRRELLDDAGKMRGIRRRLAEVQGDGSSSAMPIHEAEAASDTWEQHFNLGLLENTNLLLREIEDALIRVENGTYGICQATGELISKSRLKVIPWTRYCIECARKLENSPY